MERFDAGMAFLLQYENVAWYDNGVVRILDRRVYPYRKEYVECKTYEQVAQAIYDMVTQSGGTYTAAAMGMVLAAWQCQSTSSTNQLRFLKKAAFDLSHARPTTSARMQTTTNRSLKVITDALSKGQSTVDAAFSCAYEELQNRYAKYRKVAKHLVDKIPEDGTVMTMCFAETIIGTMLLECRERGMSPRFICPETRPYLQGARLTASVIADMCFAVHIITDNMPAAIMEREQVDVFTSAADVITMDGHIVNKVGTFQVALVASYWGIPYYVTGSPDKSHPTAETVVIEERDSRQVTEILGTRIVEKNVNAFYPAFDTTPPKLCSGVVTEKGIFSPFELESYFSEEEYHA